jgi:hypothetical protein
MEAVRSIPHCVNARERDKHQYSITVHDLGSGSYIILEKLNYLLGSELLTAVLLESYILWDITPYNTSYPCA